MGDYTIKRERPKCFSNSYNNYQSNQYQHDSTKASDNHNNSSSSSGGGSKKAVMYENEVTGAYLDTIKRLENEIQKSDNEIKHLEEFNVLAYDKIQLMTNELQQIKEENNALSNDLLDMYDYCDNQETYIKELQLKNKQLTRENEHLLNENEELRMQHIHNKWLSQKQQQRRRRQDRSSTSDIFNTEEKGPSSIFAPSSFFPNNNNKEEEEEEDEDEPVDSKILDLQLYIEKQQKQAAIAKEQADEKLKQQEEIIKSTQSYLDMERCKTRSLSQRLLSLQHQDDNNDNGSATVVAETQSMRSASDSNRFQRSSTNSNAWRRLSSITQNKRLFSNSNNDPLGNCHHHDDEVEEDAEPSLTLKNDPSSNKQQGFPLSRRRINNSRMLYYQDYKDEGSNTSIQSIQENLHGKGDRRRDTNNNAVSTLSPNNRMRQFPNVLSMLRGGGGGLPQGNNDERFSATLSDGILMKQNSDSSNISTGTDVTATKEHNSMVSNCALSAATAIVVPSSSTKKIEEEEEPKDNKNSTTNTTRLTLSAVEKKNAVSERRQLSLQKTNSNNERKTTLTERCILSSSAA